MRCRSTSGKLHLKPLILVQEMEKIGLHLHQRSTLESTGNDNGDHIFGMSVRNVDIESEVL